MCESAMALSGRGPVEICWTCLGTLCTKCRQPGTSSRRLQMLRTCLLESSHCTDVQELSKHAWQRRRSNLFECPQKFYLEGCHYWKSDADNALCHSKCPKQDVRTTDMPMHPVQRPCLSPCGMCKDADLELYVGELMDANDVGWIDIER